MHNDSTSQRQCKKTRQVRFLERPPVLGDWWILPRSAAGAWLRTIRWDAQVAVARSCLPFLPKSWFQAVELVALCGNSVGSPCVASPEQQAPRRREWVFGTYSEGLFFGWDIDEGFDAASAARLLTPTPDTWSVGSLVRDDVSQVCWCWCVCQVII